MESAGMPIYEMEPPLQKVGARAPREAWEGDLAALRPVVRLDPRLDPRFLAIEHRSGVVCCWLFVIFMAWALGPNPLDEIARIAAEPGFWTRLFIGVVEELL